MELLRMENGLLTSRLGQGTWYLGEDPRREAAEIAALREGIECGSRLIDSAEMYGSGRSESLVGRAIAPYDRAGLYLVSKVYPHNAGRRNIFKSCEASLRRLNTEYLDLYLLHWRGSVPLAETVECMEELVQRGLIRRWGVSNLDTDDMRELMRAGGENCVVDQVLYHLGSRGVEFELLPWLKEHGMGMMAYCPLAQAGSLGHELFGAPVVQRLAGARGLSPAQLLLAFCLRHENVIAIPRSASAEHARENAAAAGLELSGEELRELSREFPAPTRRTWLDIV